MSSSPSLQFDIDSIREIAQLLRESELGEICLETTGDEPSRLRLKRAPAAPIMMAAPVATEAATEEKIAPMPELGDGDTPVAHLEVTSLAVGIFREAKVPVQVGDEVKVRQVLGSVESLRVPNEVVAPAAGRVLEIGTQNGHGVEYGQTLFVIKEI